SSPAAPAPATRREQAGGSTAPLPCPAGTLWPRDCAGSRAELATLSDGRRAAPERRGCCSQSADRPEAVDREDRRISGLRIRRWRGGDAACASRCAWPMALARSIRRVDENRNRRAAPL